MMVDSDKSALGVSTPTMPDYAAMNAGEMNAASAAFAKGLGDNGLIASDFTSDRGEEVQADRQKVANAEADLIRGIAVLRIVEAFIARHNITCAEATVGDRIYESAPTLVEELAGIVGYAKEVEE